MPTPLEEWQKRLERHFTQLATARSNSGFPLFALEHGLTEGELEEIGVLLKARLAGDLWLPSHWLVWVIYATEFGYDYEGDEYWLSFEEHTPHWRERVTSGRRNQIRTWFSKFQATYHGVKPSGAWAGQFPIIAWPITHAILPKYLQWQFAKTLYDLRYRLARLGSLSPESVGQLLAANAFEASSRFQEFLQQEELAGRIVLALLSDRELEGESPIYPQTLQRLVSDLEQVQSTREWLKETRRFVADRLKGGGRGPGGESAGLVQHSEGKHVIPVAPGIRPTLMVRRSGTSTWSAVINVPSFGGVARLNPEVREFLSSTRCKIAGTGDTWLPTGWLLSSAQRRVLKSWPGACAPMVKFERPNGIIDHLVDSETRLSTGPIWLCRLGEDGLAREIMGRIVRPRGKYILLREAALPSDHPFLALCSINCDGIYAGILSVPDNLSAADINWLHKLGLQVARTVRIWPAGLCGRGWDGEGHSEWLTTETPCFGMVHDHPLDAYSLRLDNGVETLINVRAVGSPVFVKLSPLPAGRHTLSVKARRNYQTTADGVVTLEVREPEPWIRGTTSHPGLVVSLDPHDPSLDSFWEGKVGISIFGPAGRQVTCSISLANASRKELLSEPIGAFELPVTSDEWRKKLIHFLSDEDRERIYLEASSGRLLIKGDELGEYVLPLERNVKPIRWICRSIHRIMTVRLIDDTGKDDAVICRFFSFRGPAEPVNLDAESIMAGFQVRPPGGLFEASNGEYLDTIIVSTPQIEGGLQGLAVDPDLRDLDGSAVEVFHILNLLHLWSEARLVGPLVSIRRSRIIDRIINRLYSRLCGSRWADAETAYLSNPDSEPAVQQLQRSVGGSPGFSAILRRDYERMEAGTDVGTQWFSEVAARYQVCSERGLCEFALQLASHPDNLLLYPEPALNGLLLEIKKNTVLLRGARLLALLAANKNHGFSRSALPRWKW